MSPMVQMSDVGNLLSAGGFTLSTGTVAFDTHMVPFPCSADTPSPSLLRVQWTRTL